MASAAGRDKGGRCGCGGGWSYLPVAEGALSSPQAAALHWVPPAAPSTLSLSARVNGLVPPSPTMSKPLEMLWTQPGETFSVLTCSYKVKIYHYEKLFCPHVVQTRRRHRPVHLTLGSWPLVLTQKG